MDNLKAALRESRGYWVILGLCLVFAIWLDRPHDTHPHQTQRTGAAERPAPQIRAMP